MERPVAVGDRRDAVAVHAQRRSGGDAGRPDPLEAEPAVDAGDVLVLGLDEDELGAALACVLHEPRGHERREPAPARARQRGDADDRGHLADGLVRAAAEHAAGVLRHRGLREPVADAVAEEVQLDRRLTDGRRVALRRAGLADRGAGVREADVLHGAAGGERRVAGREQADGHPVGRLGRAPAPVTEHHQRHLLDLQPRRARDVEQLRADLVDPLERLRHAEIALARADRRDLVRGRHAGARDRARVVRPAGTLLDEQPERTVVLDARRRPGDGVAVRVDALEQRGAQLDAFEPAAILRRSRALSSVSSSTPCSRATSRSVRPDFDASLTMSDALS